MDAVCSQKGRWAWVPFFSKILVGGSIALPAPALSPTKQQRWADVGAKCLLSAARDLLLPCTPPAAILHGAIPLLPQLQQPALGAI